MIVWSCGVGFWKPLIKSVINQRQTIKTLHAGSCCLFTDISFDSFFLSIFYYRILMQGMNTWSGTWESIALFIYSYLLFSLEIQRCHITHMLFAYTRYTLTPIKSLTDDIFGRLYNYINKKGYHQNLLNISYMIRWSSQHTNQVYIQQK